MEQNYKRKLYLVDKKSQLKQVFSTVRIFIIFATVILVLLGAGVVYYNNTLDDMVHHNNGIIKNQDKVMILQDDIVATLMTWIQAPKEKPQKEVIREIAQQHFNNMGVLKDNIKKLKGNNTDSNKIVSYNYILIIILIAAVIIQGVVIYLFMIRKTHKIFGPIYVISAYFKEIIQGNLPSPRPLREDDELKDFYNLFTEMVDAMKDRKD